jgi:phosphoribosylformylglycinamidine synthase
MSVPVCLVTGYGINAELELAEAFRRVGGAPALLHAHDLLASPTAIDRYALVAFPGGFSFGDHLGSGKVLAALVRRELRAVLEPFIERGGLVFGVCNGFQVLCKSGMLPNLHGGWAPEVSLTHNDHAAFEDSWVTLEGNAQNGSPWLRGIAELEAPIRHGEGRFVARSSEMLEQLEKEGCVAFRYGGRNPNGSENGIAGITDRTGRVLGLMPHPEAFLSPSLHPHRESARHESALALFENGLQAARGAKVFI